MRGLSGVSQPLVKALIMINTEGKRIYSRFCDKNFWPTLEKEHEFEMSLLAKVQSMGELSEDVDIMEFGDYVVAYKQNDDIFMFVAAGRDENELIMAEVLSAFDETLATILRGQIYEENVLHNLQWVLLVIDELVDQEGIILETNSTELVERAGHGNSSFAGDISIGEQTLSQALQTARDQITRSILS